MSAADQPAFFGPYRLIRSLGRSALAERWLALHIRRQSSHVVHRFGVCEDRVERRRYTRTLERLSALDHPHLLPVEQFSFGASGRAWAVTPYTGSHDGLVTLGQLLDQKGGRFGEFEAERLIEQLLDASRCGELGGLRHGDLSASEIVVDRGGRAMIEHYGLREALRGAAGEGARGDEVLSIARLGYEALTGIRADAPPMRPSRVVRLSDRAWDDFFHACFESSGPMTAAEAMALLPSRVSESEGEGLGAVRVALRRFRRAGEAAQSEA